MKITRIQATPLHLPVTVDINGRAKTTSLSMCLVDIETDTGLIGTGLTAITEEEVIGSIVNDIAAHALLGMDPLRHEQIWERLYWLLTPRGQSGYASHAISAIDVALWDIKGQAYGEPCWRLLGAAREQVPVYATFGFAFFDCEELAEAAGKWVARGFKRLKMTVGHHALQRRDEPRPLGEVITEDVQRIRAVREAVGPDVEIYIDGNCSLDYFHALKLAQLIEPYGIAFFEEPVAQNDIPNLVKLRAKTSIPLAAGQNEGLASRFPRHDDGPGCRRGATQRLYYRRLHAVQPDCRHGVRLQHAFCQWWRLATPQHAPARRTGQRLPGRIPLGRGAVLPTGV